MDSRKKRKQKMILRGLFAAYWIVALLTYGNAANHFRNERCPEWRVEKDICREGGHASLAAISWPFYWSYRLQWEG